VSSVDLPVEEDSLPLHLVGREPLATERQVARLVLGQPALQALYGSWLASLHPTVWKEIEAMARAAGKKLNLDLRPAIEYLGLERVIEQVGLERVIEQVGLERLIEQMGIERVVDQVGLERVIEQVGIDRVLAQLGEREVVKRIGVQRWLANLSPAERRELKRLLQ
jgi:hypothetical protein